MPRYFFHSNEGHSAPDVDGFDLPDLESARRLAVRTAAAMIGQSVEEFCATGEWRMTVTDETGLTLFTLTFFATNAPALQPVEIHLEPPQAG